MIIKKASSGYTLRLSSMIFNFTQKQQANALTVL